MTIRRIACVGDPAIAALERIYEASIPASERKPTAWLGEAATRADFALLIAEAHGVAAGFATVFIPTGSAALLEYLAVDRDRRGGGVGSLLFDAVAAIVGEQPMFVEVDSPIDDFSRRRIEFYRNCKCELVDGVSYILPLPTNPPPMRLMKYPLTTMISLNGLRRSLEEIYLHVYAQAADDPRIQQMVDAFGG